MVDAEPLGLLRVVADAVGPVGPEPGPGDPVPGADRRIPLKEALDELLKGVATLLLFWERTNAGLVFGEAGGSDKARCRLLDVRLKRLRIGHQTSLPDQPPIGQERIDPVSRVRPGAISKLRSPRFPRLVWHRL